VDPKTGELDLSRIAKIAKAVNSTRTPLGSGRAKSVVEELKKSFDNCVVVCAKTVEMLGNLDFSETESSERYAGVRSQVDLLIEACHDVKIKLDEASKSIAKLHANKEILAEVDENFKAISNANEKLLAASLKVRQCAELLEKNKDDLKSLDDIRKLVPEINGASEDLKLAGEQACESLFSAVASPEITKEIIEAIVVSMQKDPNIESIQYFWKH
jgi:hypothetical protein